MTVFLAQPSSESQVGYHRLGFLTLDLSYLCSALFYYIYIIKKHFFYAHIFYNESQVSDCLIFLCLTNKEHVKPRLILTNVAALNYLLRS